MWLALEDQPHHEQDRKSEPSEGGPSRKTFAHLPPQLLGSSRRFRIVSGHTPG